MPVIESDRLDRMLELAATEEERAYRAELLTRSGQPKLLAEGDSWFAYPREYFIFGAPANVIHHLRDYNEFVIHNTARNGDEAVAMLVGDAKLDMLERLNGDQYDLLLQEEVTTLSGHSIWISFCAEKNVE